MAEAWPGTLPEYVEKESWIEVPKDSVIRGPVDIGLSQLRNRYTGDLYLIDFRIQMTKTQVDTLFDWYHVTLSKVLPFNFTDPLTSEIRELRFLTPPAATHYGVEEFLVDFSVETV